MQAQSAELRRFAVLVDYENLRHNLDRRKMDNFSWMLDPLLKKGKIVAIEIFIPDYQSMLAPLRTLSNIHRFFCVLCPKSKGGVLKDRDTVDARMDERGRFYAEHTDITDLVVVSGDSDFQGLIQFARWQQKQVTVVSSVDAIAGRMLFFDDSVKKVLIS